MADLVKMPNRIRQEAQTVEHALSCCLLENYPIFIDNHEVLAHLRGKSKDFSVLTSSLRTELESFVDQTRTFEKTANDIIAAHRRNRLTLQQHSQIVELLELPLLFETCLRNNLHEGALDILSFCTVLERRHARRASKGDDTSVISGVVSEIRSGASVLRSQLLGQLRQTCQLPACLSVITCLRRLDTLVLEQPTLIGTDSKELAVTLELKLQSDFLRARTVWLQSEIDLRVNPSASDKFIARTADPCQLLLDVIERERTGTFEIGTQFRAIFDEPTMAHADTSPELIMNSWIIERVESFVDMLRR